MRERPKRRSSTIQDSVRNQLKETDRVLSSPGASNEVEKDPKHLGFVLAGSKFVAKMLEEYDRILERNRKPQKGRKWRPSKIIMLF
jgi:hypothetical protein